MGSVYEGRDLETQQRVAVKVLTEQAKSPSDESLRRFRREARTASAIESEHIVRVLDSGTDASSGHHYLVMELLEGEDLQHVIDRCGPLEIHVALAIAAQALIGLAKAHAAGVVHRDIKPANIFLTFQPNGDIVVKLLDFGIAKLMVNPLAMPQATLLTGPGAFLGSPLYMSPEQVQSSGDVDHRSDVWSLGSTLYCALAGTAPFQHITTLGKLVFSICGTPAPSLAARAPWLPREVVQVVHRALEISEQSRYANATGMLEAIRRLLPKGDAALHQKMLMPAITERGR